MKRFKGFTLIELLIVVAIIAILAAIAVPNFLEAQVRSKVSRAKTDMRTLATALEAYYVDNNAYSGSGIDQGAQGLTVNSMLSPAANNDGSNASGRLTFATFRTGSSDGAGHMLTTPIAYINALMSDPFADTKASAFGYFCAGGIGNAAGWMVWSYGPDTDEAKKNGEIQQKLVSIPWSVSGNSMPPNMVWETFYNPNLSNPSFVLKCFGYPASALGKAYTYDPTNGTNSPGDVWRVKE